MIINLLKKGKKNVKFLEGNLKKYSVKNQYQFKGKQTWKNIIIFFYYLINNVF